MFMLIKLAQEKLRSRIFHNLNGVCDDLHICFVIETAVVV